MKKLVAVLCAAVMTFGMAVNVFAEPSPSTSGVVTKIESATDANGKTVDVKLETLSDAEKNQHFTEEEKKAVAEIKESKEKFEAIAKKVLGEQFKEGMALVDIRNLYIPEGAEVTFPLTITAKVTGVTKDSTVAVLHFTNGKWENVNATAGDGTITFTVNSLSPFAFIVDANTAKNAGSTTSPATGEANTMVWVAIVAVVAVAGMVVTYRKKRA